jgi:hypothetical protein
MPTSTEEKQVTLKEAIAGAVSSEAPPVEETPVVDKKDEKEEKKEEKPAEPVRDEDAIRGKELIQALKDPKSAALIIDTLAREAGYTKAEVLKTDSKEVKDDILEILREEFGETKEEFDFLLKKLAPAISKAIDQKVKQSEADIRQELQNQELAKETDKASTALKSLGESFFGEGEEIPKEVSDEMSKLMDKIPASADMTTKEYITFIFHSVVGSKGLVKVDKSKQKRIERAAGDAPGRLASGRTPVAEAVRDAPNKPTIKQAIALAIEELDNEK